MAIMRGSEVSGAIAARAGRSLGGNIQVVEAAVRRCAVEVPLRNYNVPLVPGQY